MVKTTVYLPDDLKRDLEQEAARTGKSEAELIREGARLIVGRARPKPRGGLFTSGDPIAHRVDELLAEGFGRD